MIKLWKKFQDVKKMMENKKSTYNAKAQKKYNEKFKFVTCKIDLNFHADVKTHAIKKGYTSLNSYIIDLIKKDIEK